MKLPFVFILALSAVAPALAQERPAPTHADVRYGPHARQVLDFWQAQSDRPAPVVVSIHGGGFRAGNKSVNGDLLRSCLAHGISVAAITYRFTDEAIAPAQFHDGARAVQFLRHRAKEWNIDKRRFGATGGSAGAGISLWLGFHDDIADPKSSDPVLRESSRVQCMAVFNAQSSYDPRLIQKMFPTSPQVGSVALKALFGLADYANPEKAPLDKIRLFEAVSPIHHLTKDDGPVLMFYGRKMEDAPNIHHPLFGQMLREKMEALKIPCEVLTGIEKLDPARTFAFFRKHLVQ